MLSDIRPLGQFDPFYSNKIMRSNKNEKNILDYMNDRHIPVDRCYTAACGIYDGVKLQNIAPYDGVTDVLLAMKSELLLLDELAGKIGVSFLRIVQGKPISFWKWEGF
jgi:hypothetical protein